MKNLSYPERLSKLNLPTLSYRRIREDIIEMYKITNGYYDKPATSFTRMWRDEHEAQRTGSRGNPLKIFHQRAKGQLRGKNCDLDQLSYGIAYRKK